MGVVNNSKLIERWQKLMEISPAKPRRAPAKELNAAAIAAKKAAIFKQWET